MRILVTGAGGMLARDLVGELAGNHTVIPLDRRALDVTDAAAVRSVVAAAGVDWVIHCAAYTKVDDAEGEPERAHAINATGSRNVALATRDVGARIAYVSTDYVFDGSHRRPWREQDPTGPLNVYGRTKLAGERAVREVLPDAHLIVRTQWLFGRNGPNFIAMILRRAAAGEPLAVVNDQTGSPTNTCDVANALADLVAAEARGTIHVANAGEATWFELAHYVVTRAGLDVQVRSCSSDDLARPARRPPYSVLDCSRFAALTGRSLRPWRQGVDTYLRDTLGSDEEQPGRLADRRG